MIQISIILPLAIFLYAGGTITSKAHLKAFENALKQAQSERWQYKNNDFLFFLSMVGEFRLWWLIAQPFEHVKQKEEG